MKKKFAVLLKILSATLGVVVTVVIILSLSLQIPYIQNVALSFVTDYLTEKTGARFSFENISIGFLNDIELKGVCIMDHHCDTMIAVKEIDAGFKGIKPHDGKFRIGNIHISGADVRIRKEADGSTNIANVFSKLKNPDKKSNILFSSDKLSIDSCRLKFDTLLEAESIFADIADIDIDRKSYGCDIRDITFHEKKRRISLDRLTLSKIHFDTTGISFNRADIQTERSRLVLDGLAVSYDSIPAVKDGTIELAIGTGTEISLETIARLAGKGKNIPLTIGLSGNLSGKVSDFSGVLNADCCENCAKVSFSVKGLPEIKKAVFDINADKISANHNSISMLLHEFGANNPPAIIKRLGNIQVTGKFHGGVMAFDADARILTGCGGMVLRGRVHPTDSTVNLDGSLQLADFNLGRALANVKTGMLNVDGNMHATHKLSGDMKVDGRFNLQSLEYGGYTFHDIIIDGNFDRNRFNGAVISQADPNMVFRADGVYDFTRDSLPFFDFRMKMDNIDLARTGLNRRDSVSRISSVIRARFSGNDIDNINGTASIDSAYYINHLDSVDIGVVGITAVNNEKGKNIIFRSRFADANFEGRNSYRNLVPFFKELTKTYIPSYDQVDKIVSSYESGDTKQETISKERIYDDGYYHFRLTAKESNNLLSIFAPGLEIAKGTNLDFYFSPVKNRFDFSLKSDAISKGRLYIEDLDIKSHNNLDSLLLNCSTALITFGKFNLTGAGLSAALHDNSIGLNAFFNDQNNMADFRIKADVGNDHKIHANILPSKLKIDTSAWDITNRKVTIDSSAIIIDSLIIRNQNQNIAIDGRVGKRLTDTLSVAIDNLDLSPATFFIKDMGYYFSAVTDGHAELISGTKEKILKGLLHVQDLKVLDDYLGDCSISSTYDKDSSRLMLDVDLDDGTRPVTGFYSLKDRILDLHTVFPKFKLKYLMPIFKGTLVDMEGTADSKIHFQLIKGKIPVLNGTARIEDFATTVSATMARYRFSADIDLKDNHISTPRGIVRDMDGNTAVLSGFFYSYNFRELKYAIDATSDRILGLNLTKNDNDLFFGKVYGKGEFHLFGDERQTFLTADMTTDYGSDFNMPFTSVASIEQNKFITFVDSSVYDKPAESTVMRRKFFNKLDRAKYSTEFDMSLTIHATPDVKCNIAYTNSVVSNIVSGTGFGNLYIHYNPRKEIFTMEGGLDIDQGTYRLMFYIADKTFQLKKGSRIWWNGDPSNPLVDFTGIYRVHTSLQPLMSEMRYSGSNVAIDCGIHMTESFFSPNFSFEITAPNATPETQSVLRNSLNTQEALSTQFFSLFLTNSFTAMTGNNGMGNMGTSIVSTTGFEFLSNQISSLLSTPNFNWRPTYKPKTEQSSDEFGVQTQVNLMKNKITLNFEGRYYVNPTYSNRQVPFSGGGDISVNLNPSGNLKFKAFTRVIDRFDETQGLQESGVGIYLTQEFDNWQDLKNRLHSYGQKRREKRDERRILREHISKVRDSIDIQFVTSAPPALDSMSAKDSLPAMDSIPAADMKASGKPAEDSMSASNISPTTISKPIEDPVIKTTGKPSDATENDKMVIFVAPFVAHLKNN